MSEEMLCECGCGQAVTARFLRGHNRRGIAPPVLIDDPASPEIPQPRPRIRAAKWSGRKLSSHGYVLLHLPGHHLASPQGDVYEHRLIAEHKLGRRLESTEVVHHVNGIKTDNRPENLEVHASIASHLQEHRTTAKCQLHRRVGGDNPEIVCACGCGQTLLKYDKYGRPRIVLRGHQSTLHWNRASRR